MKLPVNPPETSDILASIPNASRAEVLMELLAIRWRASTDGRYRHWDTFRHAPPRTDYRAEWQWLMVKNARRQQYRELPLTDLKGNPFVYCLPTPALEMISQVDRSAAGNVRGDGTGLDARNRDRFLFKSIAEEAITSSQLEGASTTRAVAKEMLTSGRTPRTHGERMIRNNFLALEYVREIADREMTPELVLELHRRVTEDTLDEPTASGRLRRADEDIVIDDEVGNRLHTPPPQSELVERMRLMCDFANGQLPEGFMPPVVRAILLHFWLAYDHPFYDGNGRTARALFYWCMAREGYWLIGFVSISGILRKARAKYSRAFLYVESDENDTTYFILYQLRVLLRAIDSLHEWIERKAMEKANSGHARESGFPLNQRQMDALDFLSAGAATRAVSTQSHARAHRVSAETARLDLNELVEWGLLERQRIGRSFRYVILSGGKPFGDTARK